MPLFCFCGVPRWIKARSPATEDHPVLLTPRNSTRIPGPLTLNPVTPVSTRAPPEPISPRHPSIPPAGTPVEPDELYDLVEDSDSDDDLDSVAQRKSTGPLQLVKSHLQRHLSQDSLPHRTVRTSVGTSPQEVERRAELKRLMHKRIQEELRDEEGDAAFLSDISSSHRSRDSIAGDSFFGGGPRDNIEFWHATVSQPVLVSNNTAESSERRASCPELHLQPVYHAGQRNSLPQMPASPNWLPRRSPPSSLGSWRLSINADQLAEYLGGAEQSYTTRDGNTFGGPPATPVPGSRPHTPNNQPPGLAHSLPRSHSSPACNASPASTRPHTLDQSPLNMWLRSQGLGPRPPSFARESDQNSVQDARVQQAELVYVRRWRSVQDSALPEPDIQRSGFVHLYDMDIHQQLATQTMNTPEVSPAPSVLQKRRQQSLDDALNQQADFLNGNLGFLAPRKSTTIDRPYDTAVNGSSVYPSAANSIYESPIASAWNLQNHLPNQGYTPVLSLLDVNELDNLRNPQKRGSSEQRVPQVARENFPESSDTLDTGIPTPVTSRSTLNTSSRPQGEIPRGTVEKSIGYFEHGNGVPSLVIQRFRQDVDRPLQSRPSKRSLLTRLRLSIPKGIRSVSRSFDSSTPDKKRETLNEEQPTTGQTSSSRPVPSAGQSERRSSFPIQAHTSRVHNRQSSAPISSYPVQHETAETPETQSTTRHTLPVNELVRVQSPPGASPQRPSPSPESPQLLPSKLGRAVKSGLGKLVPAKPFPNRTFSNRSRRSRESGDHKHGAGGPELQSRTAEHEHPQSKTVVRGMQESKGLRQLSFPHALHNMGCDGENIPLSPRMATLLHVDGTSDLAREHQSTSTLALATPADPTSYANHRKESTSTTSQFVTPQSSMYPSNNSSFHSYPQSTPESRKLPAVAHALADPTNKPHDLISVKSDGALLKRLRSSILPSLGSAPVVLTRFKTWSSMPKIRPVIDVDGLGANRVD